MVFPYRQPERSAGARYAGLFFEQIRKPENAGADVRQAEADVRQAGTDVRQEFLAVGNCKLMTRAKRL